MKEKENLEEWIVIESKSKKDSYVPLAERDWHLRQEQLDRNVRMIKFLLEREEHNPYSWEGKVTFPLKIKALIPKYSEESETNIGNVLYDELKKIGIFEGDPRSFETSISEGDVCSFGYCPSSDGEEKIFEKHTFDSLLSKVNGSSKLKSFSAIRINFHEGSLSLDKSFLLELNFFANFLDIHSKKKEGLRVIFLSCLKESLPSVSHTFFHSFYLPQLIDLQHHVLKEFQDQRLEDLENFDFCQRVTFT